MSEVLRFRGQSSEVRGQRSEGQFSKVIGAEFAYYQFGNAVLESVDFEKVNFDNHDSGKFDSKFLQKQLSSE